MKKLAHILTLLLVLQTFCFAQTNVLYLPVGDYSQTPQVGVPVTLTLISPNPRTINGIAIRQDPMAVDTDADGKAWFTNVIWGKYRVDVAGAMGTSFIGYVGTNTLGLWPLASLITNSAAVPPNPGTNYYTKVQVDALIAAHEFPLTNLLWGVRTNMTDSTNKMQIHYVFTNGVPWYGVITTN